MGTRDSSNKDKEYALQKQFMWLIHYVLQIFHMCENRWPPFTFIAWSSFDIMLKITPFSFHRKQKVTQGLTVNNGNFFSFEWTIPLTLAFSGSNCFTTSYLLKQVIFVFFAHKNYSRSFVALQLNHWCHYFNDVLATFLGLERRFNVT